MTDQDRLYHFLAGLQSWVHMELHRQEVKNLKAAMIVADALVDLKGP